MRVKGKQCGSNSKGRGNAKLGGASGASLATVANPNSLTGAYRFRMLHRVERSLCAVRAQSYQITERESDVSRNPGRSRVPRAVFFARSLFLPRQPVTETKILFVTGNPVTDKILVSVTGQSSVDPGVSIRGGVGPRRCCRGRGEVSIRGVSIPIHRHVDNILCCDCVSVSRRSCDCVDEVSTCVRYGSLVLKLHIFCRTRS